MGTLKTMYRPVPRQHGHQSPAQRRAARPHPFARRAALALACLCAALVCGVPAASAADGTITGKIAGQAGATSIGGTSVVLEIGTASGTKPEERTTSAQDDGTFRFEGVPLTSDAIYL